MNRADDADDELAAVLTRALQETDPVPPHILEAARAAWTWRTIDEELAALVFDSATDALVGTRDRDAVRQLTFRAGDLEIELMLVDPVARRIVGQLVPSQATTVRLQHAEAGVVAEHQADRLGRFTFDGVPAGPVRITVGGSEGGPVSTDWMLL